MTSDTGKWIVLTGVIVVVIGLIIYFFHDKLTWLGHLPGDIRIENDNFRFYFPVTTMIILSLVLSFIIFIIRKIFP
jgi:hypothetical protein